MYTVIVATIQNQVAEQSTSDIILYLIFALIAVLVIGIAYLFYKKAKDARLWNGKSIRSKSQTIDRICGTIYKFLSDLPLTRDYIGKVSYRYKILSPCDKKTIARKTVGTCLLSWTISLLTFVFVYLSNQRLITLIIVALIIVIVNIEISGRMAKRFETTVLEEMQKLLSEVEHFFYVECRVDDALYRSRDSLSPNMKVAVDQIYQLLLSDDKEELLREYYDNVPNKYLRTFVSQCVGVMERGDQKVDGKLLFIKNLENLQREIDIESDKLQRLNMEFLGVIICVIAPVFFIDFVKQFAISLKENMEVFYYGKIGFLLDISLIIFIICIYTIMQKSAEYAPFYQSSHRWLFRIDKISFIKTALDNYCDKYASSVERLRRTLRNLGNNIRPRHFILRNFLLAGTVFILSTSISLYLIRTEKENIVNVEIADVEMLTSAANEKQYAGMVEIIESKTKYYIQESIIMPVDKNTMVEELKRDGVFYNQLIIEAIATDIMNRVNSYKNQVFSFINLFICVCLSILAYFLPSIMMKYSSIISKDAMEDEVNQFHALISMLMHNDSMTVKQILEELESFAVVFKQSLQICINDYGTGDIEALNELKEREPYEPFRRIVDNLIRCDDMPIYQAFNEINIDRDGYMAKRKLANEKSIRKRVQRAYILAAIPFILLFAYGLMPALISSMNELNLLIKELENTAW